MGLFTKDTSGNIYDYLNRKVDRAEIKAACYNNINEIQFLRLAINIVSTYIASAISTCEFEVYKNNKSVKNATYYKLNYSPNPNDTASRLKFLLVKELVQNGESLVVNKKTNLYFAESFGIEEKSITGFKFNGVTIQETPLSETFNKKNVFYFRLDSESVKDLLELVDSKYKELVSCASNAYKKAMNNKWKLKVDANKTGDPNFQEEFATYVNEQLKEFLTSNVAVFPELNGYQLEGLDVGSDKTDSTDVRSLRKDIFDMVAQAYKMPVSMLYGNVTNLKEVINQFITFSVKPIAEMISEEMTRTLYSQNEILKGSKIAIDISSINYRDIFDVADKLDKLIYSGTTNIDEARALVSLPELNNDWSKQHWMTKNNGKIEDIMNGIDDPDNTSNNDSSEGLKGGDIDEEQQ